MGPWKYGQGSRLHYPFKFSHEIRKTLLFLLGTANVHDTVREIEVGGVWAQKDYKDTHMEMIML